MKEKKVKEVARKNKIKKMSNTITKKMKEMIIK